MEAYRNAALSPAERARDLLGRMTVREKAGQLNQRLYGFRIYTRNGEAFELTEEFKEETERFGGIGVLYGLYRADPWAEKDEQTGITPGLAAKAYNLAQEYVITHSRLGIPMLLSSECPHGHQALGGGLLPVNLAVGASFDPELLERAYEACGRQLSSGHVDLALMSVLDVLRDPRWGRSEECYSEDPFLSSRLAPAAVRGMQKAGVGCVAKHFCAQGETTGGVNASAAGIGERELREIHFPAAAACCRAGVEGIMAAYNEIDGVYCHANPWLLRRVLRQEMGFRGIVMADGLAVDLLKSVTGDTLHAGAAALKAGVDISLWDEGFSRLEEAVNIGLVEESVLDEAVCRVLELKFSRGLFERPYMEAPMLTSVQAGIDGLSLELAREAPVLLKNGKARKDANNDALLPLERKYGRIGVFGWHAADRYSQLGDYTPPVPAGSCITVLEGMKRFAPDGVEVEYAPGAGFSEGSPAELDKALRLADSCQVLVAVLGGSSSRFGGAVFDANGAAAAGSGGTVMDCGEGMDCASLQIPAAQRALFRALVKTGKPVVTVVVGGRPYCMEELAEGSAALLCAFYPGPMGGQAIAELLYGRYAPSGRLPVSIPRHPGQLPVYYNTKESCRSAYRDLPDGPLYAFGEGLAYTEFLYENIRLEPGEYGIGAAAGEPRGKAECGAAGSPAGQTAEGDCVKVIFRVKNTGGREGVAVPQVYIRRLSGDTAPRLRELKGFARIPLAPGGECEAAITLCAQDLVYAGISGKMEPISGVVRVFLCDSGREYWSGDWNRSGAEAGSSTQG